MEAGKHRSVSVNPTVMHKCVNHSLTVCFLVEQRYFFPLNNSIPFISLGDIEEIAIAKHIIQGIQKACVSELPD